MAKSDTNMIILITSAYLVVAAVRDLYDQNRGTAHKSTWFTAVLQFLLAFLLFAFARA
jgi:heme/copper-type cytochrome/quinol oxidase subunit 3